LSIPVRRSRKNRERKRVEISIRNRQRKERLEVRLMRRVVERIFAALGLQTQEVSILFASDRFVRRLNKHYRGIDLPTDVLAFSMREGEWTDIQPQVLGDVVISVETAARQAMEMGHSLDHELTILLVNGIVHLLGYDHMEKGDAERMQARERAVLSEIGSP